MVNKNVDVERHHSIELELNNSCKSKLELRIREVMMMFSISINFDHEWKCFIENWITSNLLKLYYHWLKKRNHNIEVNSVVDV